MRQLSVTFKPDIQNKLRDYAEKQNIGVAEAIRRLVDIGLRMEEYRQQDNGAGSTFNELVTLLTQVKKLAETNMTLILQINMLEQSNFKYHQGEEAFQKRIKEVRDYASKWANDYSNKM